MISICARFAGIVALGLTGFRYQFIAGLTVVTSLVIYARLLRKVS